jgi:hypothetical protein
MLLQQQLSEHFSLEELTFSEIASRNKIDNTPSDAIIAKLKFTASQMELVRSALGNNFIHVNSGYRCLAANTLLGSKSTSQHTKGEAVDFICRPFGTPRDIVLLLKSSNIKFDQLILEFDSWVHISFVSSTKPRRQVLIIDKLGTRLFS